jgi:hypothetical protein
MAAQYVTDTFHVPGVVSYEEFSSYANAVMDLTITAPEGMVAVNAGIQVGSIVLDDPVPGWEQPQFPPASLGYPIDDGASWRLYADLIRPRFGQTGHPEDPDLDRGEAWDAPGFTVTGYLIAVTAD